MIELTKIPIMKRAKPLHHMYILIVIKKRRGSLTTQGGKESLKSVLAKETASYNKISKFDAL